MTTEGRISSLDRGKKKLDAVFWGGVFLWAGLVFGADVLGILPQIGTAIAWSWIFSGAGMYGLLMGLVRMALPRYSNPTTWDWVWAGIFLIIGAAGFISANVPVWLILILIGAAILGNAIVSRE